MRLLPINGAFIALYFGSRQHSQMHSGVFSLIREPIFLRASSEDFLCEDKTKMGSKSAVLVEENFVLNFTKLYFFLRLLRQLKKITFDSRVAVVYDTGDYSEEHGVEGSGWGGVGRRMRICWCWGTQKLRRVWP